LYEGTNDSILGLRISHSTFRIKGHEKQILFGTHENLILRRKCRPNQKGNPFLAAFSFRFNAYPIFKVLSQIALKSILNILFNVHTNIFSLTL